MYHTLAMQEARMAYTSLQKIFRLFRQTKPTTVTAVKTRESVKLAIHFT